MNEAAEPLTVVIGASPKRERFSNKAVLRLRDSGLPVRALGYRLGLISDVEIEIGRPEIDNVHTIAMYIGPARQEVLYDYILELHPQRIIFNPGTENPAFMAMARNQGIAVVENCVLVMLNSGIY